MAKTFPSQKHDTLIRNHLKQCPLAWLPSDALLMMPLLTLQWHMNLCIQRKRFGNWQALDFSTTARSSVQRVGGASAFLEVQTTSWTMGPMGNLFVSSHVHAFERKMWEKPLGLKVHDRIPSCTTRTFLLLPLASSLPKARCTQRETISAPALCDRKAPAKSQALKASQQSGSSAISQATRAHHSGVRWATSFKANGTQPLAKDANITRSPHPQRFHKVHSAACATWMSWEGAACKRMTPSVSWSFKPLSTLRSSSSAAATQAASKRVSNSSEDSLCASCSLL